MSELPSDVVATLTRSLSAAREAARERRLGSLEGDVATVRRVARTRVADTDLAAELQYGCDRVEALAADEPLVAAEYLRAMHERVAGEA